MLDAIHKIAVISDTHGLLRPEVSEILKQCEVILHGGDINKQSILDEIQTISKVPDAANLYVVRGNNDKAWAKDLPVEVTVNLFGRKIYMIHNKKQITDAAKDADIIIYGHSHKYEEKYENGKLWLNPGSCGPRRFNKPVTMAVLNIDTKAKSVSIEKIDLTPETPKIQTPNHTDLKPLIESIITDMQHGRTIDYMIEHYKISRDFAEQICRIYVTHPGVDAQGIMNKMEVSALQK